MVLLLILLNAIVLVLILMWVSFSCYFIGEVWYFGLFLGFYGYLLDVFVSL